MACETYYLQLHHYFDNPNERENQSHLKQHLLSCSECKTFLSDLEKISTHLERIVYPEPSPQLTDRIFQSVQQLPSPVQRVSFFKMMASAILILSAFFLVWSQWKPPISSTKEQQTKKISLPIFEEKNRMTEAEKQKHSEALLQWFASFETQDTSFLKKTFFSLNFSESFQQYRQNLQKQFQFTFSFSDLPSWNISLVEEKKTFESVEEDFSEFFHIVKKDLSFLSFGL